MPRIDRRGPEDLRHCEMRRHFQRYPAGSVLIEMGNTKVVCAATVEDRVPFFLRGTGEGWVTAEYSLLPSATNTRTPREAPRGHQSGRTQEIQRLIGRSLRSVVDTNRAAVIDLLNRFTQEVKPLKYYVDPLGDIIIDVCVFAKNDTLDSELVYTMIQIIGQQIDTQYPEIMQALQA